MFRCERCGSSYSAMHAMAIENCPRCQAKDQVTSQLVFKPFDFPEETPSKLRSVPLTVAAAEVSRNDEAWAGRPSTSPR